MRDKAYVRLINPHSEGNCRNDNQAVLAQKPLLVVAAHVVIKSGVIGQCLASL